MTATSFVDPGWVGPTEGLVPEDLTLPPRPALVTRLERRLPPRGPAGRAGARAPASRAARELGRSPP